MRIEPLSVEPKLKTRHSLTYSAYGLPNMRTLPVSTSGHELRLAPAIVGVRRCSIAPLEVLRAF